ncbi:MAG: hypothetical protein RLY14_1623 [Planctomycetota bacterium]|jgi:hypothetical protein
MVIGDLYAGEYTMKSFAERLKFRRNKQSKVFLTRSEEVPTQSQLKDLSCVEGGCFHVACRWTGKMPDVLLFMKNLMGANELSDARRMLFARFMIANTKRIRWLQI